MKRITVLSGKGGVGKSSITASLAVLLSEEHKIVCVDCDVDAPNLGLVLGLKEKNYEKWKPLSTNKKAKLIPEKCTGCKKCVESCYFDAIEWDEKKKKPVFKEFGCEGCGTCDLICPSNAIEIFDVNNARIGYGKTKYDFPIVSGQLEIGESGSGKVVAVVKNLGESKSKNAEIMLIDAAAGVGCPVIASITGSDYVVVVTEPTPSAFSDMKKALEIVNHFNISHGIIINKFDLNPEFSKELEDFAKENNIKILAKIPYDRTFLKAVTNLVPVIEYSNDLKKIFNEIANKIKREVL